MRIKNESKRLYCFSGGQVLPGRVVDVKDEAVAKALIKAYPGELIALENIEVEVIEPVAKEEAEEVSETETPKASKAKKKGSKKK